MCEASTEVNGHIRKLLHPQRIQRLEILMIGSPYRVKELRTRMKCHNPRRIVVITKLIAMEGLVGPWGDQTIECVRGSGA